MKIPTAIITLTILMAASTGFAAEPGNGPGGQGGPGGGLREACKDDAQSFCKGVQPGGGRILDCLKDHYKEISDGCYNALQNMASHGGGPGGAPHDGPPPDDGH